MPRLPSLLLFAGAVLASSSARAAAPPDVAAAEALFREARAAARTGDHATACPKFRESYRLDPAVGTLLNLADCEEHDGHLVDSLRRFEEAFGRLSPTDDRVPYVRSRINALTGRVARIEATIATDAELSVYVDGIEMPRNGRSVAMRVDPGWHEVVVQGQGLRDRFPLALREGERKELDLARATRSPRPSAPRPDATAASPRAPVFPFVLAGVGAASLVASGVFAGLMFDAKDRADRHCTANECDDAGLEATESGKLFGTLGGAAFAVGAASLAVGTFLFVRDRSRHKETPMVSFGPGGVVLRGTL